MFLVCVEKHRKALVRAILQLQLQKQICGYQSYSNEVERVRNHTYTSGEHLWESNVTFGVAHMSTQFNTSQTLVHTPVSTVQVQLQSQLTPQVEIARFFNSESISRSYATGHMGTPLSILPRMRSSTGYSSQASHVAQCSPLVYVRFDNLLPLYTLGYSHRVLLATICIQIAMLLYHSLRLPIIVHCVQDHDYVNEHNRVRAVWDIYS